MHDKNKLRYRHDVDNAARLVSVQMKGGISFDTAKVMAIESLRVRALAIRTMKESEFLRAKQWVFEAPEVGDERNQAAFSIDGYKTCNTDFEAAKADVDKSYQREIGFVDQLTPKLFEISKARNFK